MAALPYMPLFVADYLADTAHLTAIQHGAYLLLIMNYWQRGGPLPNDDARLARIARMNKRDWANNRDDILEFFSVQENTLHHSRIDTELARVEAKSLKCSEAGRASVERRFGKRATNAKQTLNHTEAQAHTEEESSNDDSSSGDEPALAVEEVFGSYKSLASDLGLAVPRDLTPERRQLIRGRITQRPIQDFQTVFARCRGSPFLRGDNGRTPLTVDWLFKKGNFQKVLEGNYSG